MQAKPLKLSPKKGGNGYTSSFSVSIGIAELRAVGLIDEDGRPMEVEKLLDTQNQQIIIRRKLGD